MKLAIPLDIATQSLEDDTTFSIMKMNVTSLVEI